MQIKQRQILGEAPKKGSRPFVSKYIGEIIKLNLLHNQSHSSEPANELALKPDYWRTFYVALK